MKEERDRVLVVFPSSLRGDWCPCISHETGAASPKEPGAKTYCGRALTQDTTWEPQSNEMPWEPDCIPCQRRSLKLRGIASISARLDQRGDEA